MRGAPDADLILITHAHYDHFSPDDIAKYGKDSTKCCPPQSMKDDMEKNGVIMMDYLCHGSGRRVSTAGIYIKAVPAYNKLKPFHPRRNGWLGYVFRCGRGTQDLCSRRYGCAQREHSTHCDIAMMPIGGTYTMNAKEAARLSMSSGPLWSFPRTMARSSASRPTLMNLRREWMRELK